MTQLKAHLAEQVPLESNRLMPLGIGCIGKLAEAPESGCSNE